MGRTKAPNENIVKKIRDVLYKNPQGIWIREIARKSGISKSCVHVYLTHHMINEIEEVVSVSSLVKFYKLKGDKNV
ncbi:MAG: hypothetical protein NTY20_01220 [Candidatus Aenigmarchaeota archaeon]|nr:hypothetical protein [Candidatus Aenigmarchaeota archaeon]